MSHFLASFLAQQTLSIVVIGASGDLAKKKTYPSLLNLFESCLLPEDTVIWGYARTAKTHQELRDHLRPHLIKTGTSEIIVNDFLDMCYYHAGKSYGDEEAYTGLISNIRNFEANTPSAGCNRLFYLAVPPNVFGESGLAIKKVGMSTTGWTRVVIEKPFGRDLASCNELLDTLATQFDEENLYRVRTGRRKRTLWSIVYCCMFIDKLFYSLLLCRLTITWERKSFRTCNSFDSAIQSGSGCGTETPLKTLHLPSRSLTERTVEVATLIIMESFAIFCRITYCKSLLCLLWNRPMVMMEIRFEMPKQMS